MVNRRALPPAYSSLSGDTSPPARSRKITVANGVRDMREHLGLTVKKFSELVGINPQTITAIENYRRELKAWEAWEMAEACGCTVEVLIGYAEEKVLRAQKQAMEERREE